MTLAERVWDALGPDSQAGWPLDYVLNALQLAATIVWADTIRPTTTTTLTFTNGRAPIPSNVWVMEVRTPNVRIRPDGAELVVYPSSTTEVEVAGSPVPPLMTESTTTAGWEPELDEVVVLWAAAILLADTRPDAAAAYVSAAEDIRRRFMAEWRNAQEWRLRRGRP